MTTAPAVGAPVVDELTCRDPDVVSPEGSRTWWARGRNFVVAITELAAADRLAEYAVADEYALLVTDDTEVTVEQDGGSSASVVEPAFVVVPAGTSVVRAAAPATVVRVFSAYCEEQLRRAVNYADGVDPRAAPLPTSAPASAGRIRVHRLRDVPSEAGRLGRIFRTTSLMVNWFPVQIGPRETEALSPHSHEHFEQMSVTLGGDYVHHFRTPWTPQMSQWRDDQHVPVGSPSMALIPPTVVHTTRAVGEGRHSLVDVFAPPRADFLAKGWVLNAADYPRATP
ncbi:MAG TPA: hypothetical protein VGE11_06665 [Pseudonocardia sp.]